MYFLIAQSTGAAPTTSQLINVLIQILIDLSKSPSGAIVVLLLVGAIILYPTIVSEWRKHKADLKLASQETYWKEKIAEKDLELKESNAKLVEKIREKDLELLELYKLMAGRDDAWKIKYESIVEKSYRTTSRVADNLDELNALNRLNKQFLEHMCYATNKLELGEDVIKDIIDKEQPSPNNGKNGRDENAKLNNKPS